VDFVARVLRKRIIGEDIEVDVAAFQKDNEERLSQQMQLVEERMDEQERSIFESNKRRDLFHRALDKFRIPLQTLAIVIERHGPFGQAQAHARMIRETIKCSKMELVDRGLSEKSHSWKIVLTGLDLLEAIMLRKSSSISTQHDLLDIRWLGEEHCSLRANITAIDTETSPPIP